MQISSEAFGMKIEELNEGEHVQVSKMLVDLWEEPNSLRKARSYLLNGYKSSIKEDKFFVIKENKKVINYKKQDV